MSTHSHVPGALEGVRFPGAGGIAEQSWRGNLKELEAALADSTAAWKLVVGHHPVLSSGGAHGDQSELQQHVQPVLEKYGVQVGYSAATPLVVSSEYLPIFLQFPAP